MIRHPPRSTLFPYTPLSRSSSRRDDGADGSGRAEKCARPLLAGSADAEQVLHRQLVQPLELQPALAQGHRVVGLVAQRDRKSTRLNSSHANISYAVFCLKKQ